MKGIFTRDDGIMVRGYETETGFYCDYSNGDHRLIFDRIHMNIYNMGELGIDDFRKEFQLKMDDRQAIKLIRSGQMKFEGETKEQSIEFFNK